MRNGSAVALGVRILAVLAAARGASPPVVAASWIESLVMPGDVAKIHAPIEHECVKCHERFDKAAQDRLCLACHVDVGADLEARHGYHGRMAPVRDLACKACHAEHRGRNATLVRLDRGAFDHATTDFPLRGRHAIAKCDDCHSSGSRYREASAGCADCHARDDPHQGCLGLACDSCHVETAWTRARFDHDGTAFPLDGGHRAATCENCHPTKRYTSTPTACIACHADDDGHRGALGPDCRSCHTTHAWSSPRFDHLRETRFALLGKHATTPCESCHTPGQRDVPATCIGCHADDDHHEGKFGGSCDTCHTAIDWRRLTFEHERATGYPLRGRHGDIPCTACHDDMLYDRQLDPSCYACHRDDDPHRGQQGTACHACHDEGGWRRRVQFDHDLTRFPLLGAHTCAACADCHASPVFREVARVCAACHEADDVHRGRFGTGCNDCHNPTSWKAWDFDHGARTTFRLDAAHAGVPCDGCHRERVEGRVDLSDRCVDCHAADDVHGGRFGPFCERCHATSDFRAIHAGE